MMQSDDAKRYNPLEANIGESNSESIKRSHVLVVGTALEFYLYLTNFNETLQELVELGVKFSKTLS